MGNIKKNFKEFINENKEYQLGDMWSNDFDYEGMIDAILNVSFEDNIKDIEKLKKSAVDVNYHDEAIVLGEIIDAIENNDKEKFKSLSNKLAEIYNEDEINESLEGGVKALPVDVYRTGNVDASNGGLSSENDELMFVFDDLQSPFETEEGEDYLVLVKRNLFNKEVLSAVPKSILDSGRHSMFGGNFIYTSDSRFPSNAPIKVHDRIE